jgi:hypothetical protein
MCYREKLSFLTCKCTLKTTSYCPSFLRYEYKQYGAPRKRSEASSVEYVTIPWRKCRFAERDDVVVAARCPQCNEEERQGYGTGRGYVDYHLGRDAFYTGEGKDGMGDRGRTRKGGKAKDDKNDKEKNGRLVKRRIEGVTWQYDGYYVVR